MKSSHSSPPSEDPTLEEMFNHLLENSPIYIFFKDDRARAIQLSRNFEKMLGRPLGELLGSTMDELFPSDLAKSMMADDVRILKEGRTVTVEEELNGRVYTTTKFPIVREGKPPYLAGYTIDVTERMRVEEALYRSQHMLQTILDTIPAAVFWKDRDSIFLGGNRTWLEAIGLESSESVIGKSDYDLPWDRGQAESFRKDDKSVIESGAAKYNIIESYLRADGTLAWARTHKVPLRDSGGDIIGVLGTYEDITERKRAEEDLCQRELELRTLMDNLPDIVVRWDLRKRLTFVNKAATKVMGKTWEAFEGKTVYDIGLPQALAEQLDTKLQKVLETKRAIPAHYVIPTPSGPRYIDTLTLPELDGTGALQSILSINHDVTERMRAEEELQKAQKLESLGLLAGGIAHDFNNLLGGIFGYIELSVDESDKSRANAYLAKAMNVIERARALSGQLLTFAKGGAPIRKIAPLFPCVWETAEFALSGTNVLCRFDAPYGLWPCDYDQNQIGQVIDNIVINAKEAMPVGGMVELTARNIVLGERAHPLLAPGDYVKISIKDNGVGIPKELTSRVFDPFFTTKTKGHGLGLATCYSIVNRHGGHIELESELGKGSTFHLYLPAVPAAVASRAEATTVLHKGIGTFLVMDDEPSMRETIRKMLISFGYDVICKDNGREAVDAFVSEMNSGRSLCGAIFDLTVPGGMGGKDAVDEIRKLNENIPVFVASGYSEDPVIKSPADYGFTDSICKPFRKIELSSMLNKHLKTRE